MTTKANGAQEDRAAITITKAQLAAALRGWEEEARAGKTLSHEASRALPLDEHARACADGLWRKLGGPA